MFPCIGSQWTPCAQQPKVHTTGKNRKRYLFGAVDFFSGRLFYRVTPRKNTRHFLRFLNQIDRQLEPHVQIIMVLDNFSVHKAQAVKQWIRDHPNRLRLVFLPTYSPWLNPIEMLWRMLKLTILKNQPFSQLRHVTKAALTLLRSLSNQLVLATIGNKGLQ